MKGPGKAPPLWAPRKLSEKEVAELRRAQNGLCPICRASLDSHQRKPVVDHCHEDGRVRGLVHEACNIRLGYVEKLLRGNDARAKAERWRIELPAGWVADCLKYLGHKVRVNSYDTPTDWQNVAELLCRADMTIGQAARELGISSRMLRYWRAGTHKPPRMALLALEHLVYLQRQVTD